MYKHQMASGVSIGIKNTMRSLTKGLPLINLPEPAEFKIKIANTIEEREAVFRLSYKIYLEKGFIHENSNEWLIRNYDTHKETVILIVQDNEKNIVGSVTLVFDEDCKLPASKIFNDELKIVKACGFKIAEISRLIIHPDYRNSKEILLLLFNYLEIYCYHVKNYTGVIVQVNPRHKSFYKLLLNFEEIGAEKLSPYLNNAPTNLLLLPTSKYLSEVKRLSSYKNINKKERSFYTYFLKPEQEMLVAHYLKRQIKEISAEEKMYFGFTESGINMAVCR